METVKVEVEQDHIESLAKVRKPIIAIEELIWNGLDADANRIQVDLVMNQLDGLAKVRVTDHGTGIPYSTCKDAFGHLGGSAKSRISLTPGGRTPHGKEGKGRFRAFGIGKNVTWESRYRANGVVNKFTIKGNRTFITEFEIGDEQETEGSNTGVIVTIDGLESNFPSLLDAERSADELSKRLEPVSKLR